MKIYNRVVLSIETGKVLEEDYFEYLGPVCEAKGGSGGGGSSSGKVDYPAYMKEAHGDWLDRDGAADIEVGHSITELINAGIDNSPYSGEVAYDPDEDITAFLAALVEFDTEVDSITTTWVSLLSTITIDATTQIDTAVVAHAALLDDRLTTEVLPRFQAGMRDINAVISSTFVLGQSTIEAFNTREVADFSAKARLQNLALKSGERADTLSLLQLKLQYRDSVTKAIIEARRIKVVMKKEELEEQLSIDEKEYKWPCELYQYGSNVLSSISGSAISVGDKIQKGSALGGALSGAAAGAMIGSSTGVPGGTLVGAGIGAVLGGIF